jgi:hypothetical protein
MCSMRGDVGSCHFVQKGRSYRTDILFKDMFPIIVFEVSTTLELKGLCELGVCTPRCIPKKVKSFWVKTFIG